MIPILISSASFFVLLFLVSFLVGTFKEKKMFYSYLTAIIVGRGLLFINLVIIVTFIIKAIILL